MKTFTDIEYENRKNRTKRKDFLDEMDRIIPWDDLVAIIYLHYYSDRHISPACDVKKMLRMYLLQTWFNISDEELGDAIYDSYAFRKFMGADFDENTILSTTALSKFRHLIKKEKISEKIFDKIKEALDKNGKLINNGKITDAMIIDTPCQ